MDLQQYQELSKRTMPFGGEPSNQVEFENMLGNYAMGLVGEITELFAIMTSDYPHTSDNERLAKEMGDICHYAVGLNLISGIELPKSLESVYGSAIGTNGCLEGLICEGGLILEEAKKVIYHRHDFEKNEFSANEILLMLNVIAKDEGYEMSEIYQMNIDKLKQRYPETFNTADSIARVDVVEGKA